jgi:hypothetical protein
LISFLTGLSKNLLDRFSFESFDWGYAFDCDTVS